MNYLLHMDQVLSVPDMEVVVDTGDWGCWTPQKICRCQSTFWPPNSRKTHIFFHSKLLLDDSSNFTSSMALYQKWKVKLIFRGACNTLMTWPGWPWPPYHDWSTPLPLRFGALLCWATVTWNFSIFNRCCLSQHYKVVCIQGLLSLSSPGVGKWVPTAAGKAKEGMAHSDCGWTCGRAGKTLKSPENTRAIPERFCAVVFYYEEALYCTFYLYSTLRETDSFKPRRSAFIV